MMFERLTFRSVSVRPVLRADAPPGRLQGRPVRPVADDPDRYRDRGGHRRAQLSGAVSQGVRAQHRAVIHDLAAARVGQPIRPLDDFQKGLKSLNLVGNEGIVDDRRVGSRHGGVGCARQGRQHAARGVSRRIARAGAGLQQQRAVADRGRIARRRGARTRRRGRLQGPQAAARAREARRRSRGDRHGPRGGRRRHQADGRFQSGPEPRRRAAPLPRARRPGALLARGADRLQQSRGLRAARARAEDADPARREFLRPARAVSGLRRWAAATT